MILKNEKDDFTKIKCTILFLGMFKVSNGLIFITGNFCMMYLKIRSPTIAKSKNELTKTSGSWSGNCSLRIKKPPIPIAKKESIK